MDATGLDIEALRKAAEAEVKRLEQRGNGRDDSSAPKTERVLGGLLELSPSLASALNVTVNWLQPRIRRYVETGVRTTALPLLMRVGMNGERAQRAANFMADSAGWALTFYDEVGGLVGDTRKHFGQHSELKQRLSKVNVAHGGKANSLDALKGNEVVGVEVRRLTMRLHTALIGEACKLLSSAPQAWIKVLDGQGKGKSGNMNMLPGENIDAYIERFSCAVDRELSQAEKIEGAIHSRLEPIQSRLEEKINDPSRRRQIIRNIEARLRERLQEQAAPQEIDEKTISELMVPFGAISSVVARDMLLKGRSDEEKGTNSTAFDMIEKLADAVINDENAQSVGGLRLAAYIRKIFDTHQDNMGQPHIGKRFDEKLDYACKEIAKAITEGQMHPMALVDLVGERKIVQDKGKRIASREQVTVALEEAIKRMPAKFAVDANEYMAEATVTEEDLKHALDTQEEKDRAFYVSLMPEEVARKIGVKEEEIKAAHDVASRDFAERLSQVALDLGTLSDEQLKDKLSGKEIALIRKIAPKLKGGDVHEAMQHVSRKGNFADTLDTLEVNALGAGLVNHPGALYEEAGHRLFEKGAGEASHPLHDDTLVETEHTGQEWASKIERKKERDALSGKHHRGDELELEPDDDEYVAEESAPKGGRNHHKEPGSHIHQAAHVGRQEDHHRRAH